MPVPSQEYDSSCPFIFYVFCHLNLPYDSGLSDRIFLRVQYCCDFTFFLGRTLGSNLIFKSWIHSKIFNKDSSILSFIGDNTYTSLIYPFYNKILDKTVMFDISTLSFLICSQKLNSKACLLHQWTFSNISQKIYPMFLILNTLNIKNTHSFFHNLSNTV